MAKRLEYIYCIGFKIVLLIKKILHRFITKLLINNSLRFKLLLRTAIKPYNNLTMKQYKPFLAIIYCPFTKWTNISSETN